MSRVEDASQESSRQPLPRYWETPGINPPCVEIDLTIMSFLLGRGVERRRKTTAKGGVVDDGPSYRRSEGGPDYG
jgi:hypothetical protein